MPGSKVNHPYHARKFKLVNHPYHARKFKLVNHPYHARKFKLALLSAMKNKVQFSSRAM